MFKTYIYSGASWDAAFLQLGQFKIIEIFFYKSYIGKEAGVLTATAKKIFAVKFHSGVCH